MTNEEAIKVLDNALYGGGNAFVMSEFRDAIKMALGTLKQEHILKTAELDTLSLPSNLDEVAEEIVKDWLAYGDGEYKKLVKSGAEWMAGQGETHELTVERPVLGPPMICCPVHTDNGDKVVVQIRKK